MKTFIDLGLRGELLKAVSELGFISPTPIQEKTIPQILETQNDIVGLAQTGTGKTAAFGLPVIQQLTPGTNTVQAIVLCPTRELCLQITTDLVSYCKYMNHISILPVYGGSSYETQIRGLKKGVHIVVGTPGRTLDLIKRKALKINSINWLILDEADEMLNMGFRDDIDAILEDTPKNKQTLLFSATMPDGVRRIASEYMNDPIDITQGKKNVGAENVSHFYYVVRSSDRYLALKRLADINPNIYGIVFCRTRSETKDVASKLIQDGYNADALHGDLSQSQRDYVMQRFRSKQLQLLIATDVAARGIDVTDLTHIINYNLPDDPEVYIHRSGRTGRAGKQGISIIISHSRERGRIKDLENLTGKKIIYKPVPSGKEICEKRLYSLMDKIENIEVDETQIEPYLPAIFKKLEWLGREELLKRFVSVEFDRFLEYYKNAGDINATGERERTNEKTGERSPKKHSSNRNFSRFYINIGSKHNIKVPNLIGLINENTKKRDIEIGKIDILRNFSFFEADKNYEKLILDSFQNKDYGNVKLIVQISKPEKNSSERESNYMKNGNWNEKSKFKKVRTLKGKKTGRR